MAFHAQLAAVDATPDSPLGASTKMSTSYESLLKQAFECRRCQGTDWFASGSHGADYRFPPIIGCHSKPKLLFVGLNPRASETNVQLHEAVSGSYQAFRDLSNNRTPEGDRYIAPAGRERHYRLHTRIARDVFPGQKFEEVAAVSELHLCASESASRLPTDGPCNTVFLPRVLQSCSPEIVVALGARVRDWFRTRATLELDERQLMAKVGGSSYRVLVLPHPNSRGPKEEEWQRGIALMQWHFGTPVRQSRQQQPSQRRPVPPAHATHDKPPEAQGSRQTASDRDAGNKGGRPTITRECNWHVRQGWKPGQRPADLSRLERDGGFIRFVLIRDGSPKYWLDMDADQWKTALGDYYYGKWEQNGYATRLTSTSGGAPTERFVARWASHVTRVG